jgi:hypothetical protein
MAILAIDNPISGDIVIVASKTRAKRVIIPG